MNYGLRADKVDAYVHEGQISPRIGFVYQATDTTALHAGYARYFTPPPTELISPTDIALFQGTTNQLPTNVNAETLSERSHYFDVGVSQKIGDGLTLGLDGYYRKVHNLLDEGQFGAALIFSPFNYAQGRVRGVEFSSDYTQRQLHRVSQRLVEPRDGQGHRHRPIQFRSGRTRLHRQPLGASGSRPAPGRQRRHLVQLERHAHRRRFPVRIGLARGFRQLGAPAGSTGSSICRRIARSICRRSARPTSASR